MCRVSQVTKEGKYLQSDVPRQLVYGTMVYVRQTIVADASNALSRAVCIAVRYSAVRRQFGSQDGGPELQVLLPLPIFFFYMYLSLVNVQVLSIAASSFLKLSLCIIFEDKFSNENSIYDK